MQDGQFRTLIKSITPNILFATASTSTSEMAAQQNNAKAFPLFAKKLKSDNLKDFSGYVKKLGTWLNVEKAYYAEGRPEVRVPALCCLTRI